MKLGYVILYVQNLEAALSFYERAFGLTRKFVQAPYGELDTGGTTLAFSERAFVETLVPAELAPVSRQTAAPPMEVGLVTPEVDQAFARAVAAGALAVKAPETKPWGQRVAYVRDADGFLVELCSPMG